MCRERMHRVNLRSSEGLGQPEHLSEGGEDAPKFLSRSQRARHLGGGFLEECLPMIVQSIVNADIGRLLLRAFTSSVLSF